VVSVAHAQLQVSGVEASEQVGDVRCCAGLCRRPLPPLSTASYRIFDDDAGAPKMSTCPPGIQGRPNDWQVRPTAVHTSRRLCLLQGRMKVHRSVSDSGTTTAGCPLLMCTVTECSGVQRRVVLGGGGRFWGFCRLALSRRRRHAQFALLVPTAAAPPYRSAWRQVRRRSGCRRPAGQFTSSESARPKSHRLRFEKSSEIGLGRTLGVQVQSIPGYDG